MTGKDIKEAADQKAAFFVLERSGAGTAKALSSLRHT